MPTLRICPASRSNSDLSDGSAKWRPMVPDSLSLGRQSGIANVFISQQPICTTRSVPREVRFIS
jgi:hypothetical protein